MVWVKSAEGRRQQNDNTFAGEPKRGRFTQKKYNCKEGIMGL